MAAEAEIPVPAYSTTQCIMSGIVKSVSMLLTAVRVTERATLPPTRYENTFEELPPGEHAMSIIPIKKRGSSPKSLPSIQATIGNTTICPTIPTTSPPGFEATFLNASKSNPNPNWNISRHSIGITIKTVFISFYSISIAII